MTAYEREGAEGSQLSQTLDFVPLRQGAVRGPLHREKITNCSYFFSLVMSYLLTEVMIIID